MRGLCNLYSGSTSAPSDNTWGGEEGKNTTFYFSIKIPAKKNPFWMNTWMNYWTSPAFRLVKSLFKVNVQQKKVTSFPILAVDSMAVLVTSPLRFTVEWVETWFSSFCAVFLFESELKRTLDHFSCPCESLRENFFYSLKRLWQKNGSTRIFNGIPVR